MQRIFGDDRCEFFFERASCLRSYAFCTCACTNRCCLPLQGAAHMYALRCGRRHRALRDPLGHHAAALGAVVAVVRRDAPQGRVLFGPAPAGAPPGPSRPCGRPKRGVFVFARFNIRFTCAVVMNG
jgi:hypothetical protein